MVVGATLCAKHGGNRQDIQDKAHAMTALATLLDASPKPWPEALAEIIHDFHSLYVHEKTQARSELDTDGAVTAETMTRWVDTGRLTATTILAAERVGILDKAVQLQEQRVSLETRTIAHVVRSVVTPLLDWFERAGLASPEQLREADQERGELNHSIEYYEAQSELQQLRNWAPAMFRAVLSRTDTRSASEAPAELPPLPSTLDSYVLVRRDELEALRECARRHTPAISDRPADVYVPDDADITSPAPESPAGSTSDRRPPEVGLISTTATRHYRGR